VVLSDERLREAEARFGTPEDLSLQFSIRWAEMEPRFALDELQGPVREILLGTGTGLFRHRAALTDATIDLMSRSALLR